MRSLTLVVTLTLLAPVTRATTPSQHPQELVPHTEARDIEQIAEIISSGVLEQFKKTGQATRDAHAKHHGCVTAKVTVLPSLAKEYAVGVFAKPQQYRGLVRFSNGMGKVGDDRDSDGRGFALKLLGVPGRKILEGEETAVTQDFLMINHPVFFVRNVADYVAFSKAMGTGSPMSFFIGLNPFKWHLREAFIAKSIGRKKVTNPLATRYYSMTPILMGQTPAKYSVIPCEGQTFVRVPSSPNQLREAMARQLKPTGDLGPGACFELGIQLQTDPMRMPVEDPRLEWSEKLSPYRTVAKIEISRQEFLSKQALLDCENLSYTPWHSLPEHRPIGGIQRARKSVYQTISRLRHELNQQPRIEPK